MRRLLPLLLLATSCSDGGPPVAIDIKVPSTATWRTIDAAPGTAIGAPVWTGRDLVLWSGSVTADPADEGVAWNAATGQWRALPPSPLTPRSQHSGVWTGKEILYVGGFHRPDASADGAAFNPATDRWRKLPPLPMGGRVDAEAVWTGREMVVWGGSTGCCGDSIIHRPEAAAYDPVGNRWRRLADVPPPWSGDDGAAVTAAVDGRMLVWREGRLGALDLDANRWHDLGSPPPGGTDECMVSDGPVSVGRFGAGRLAVWHGGCDATRGTAYDLRTGAWSALGDAPDDGLSALVATPTVFAVSARRARLLRYHDTERTWEPLDVPDTFATHPFVQWTGAEVLVWGGFSEQGARRTGLLYRP